METPHLSLEGAAPLASNSRTGIEQREDTPQLVSPAHHSAPGGTSEVTARSMVEQAAPQRDRVFEPIRSRGPIAQTDAEGEAAVGMKPQSYTPRRGELVRLGLVIDSGQRRATASNRPAAVWLVREHAAASAAAREEVNQ